MKIPQPGEFYVFEIVDNKMKQISTEFNCIEDANSFIDIMKQTYRHSDTILVAMEVK